VHRIEQLSPLHLARVAPGARLRVSLIPGMSESLRIEGGLRPAPGFCRRVRDRFWDSRSLASYASPRAADCGRRAS